MSDPTNAPPLCANCGTTMSDRPYQEWFCPRCAEYGRNLGTVQPTEPAHPEFEELAQSDPNHLLGMHVMRYPYPEGEEPMGQIYAYDESEQELRIETDLEEPFDSTERVIALDTFFEYLWTPDGPQDTEYPEPVRLGVIQ